jgi:hypothetical protein
LLAHRMAALEASLGIRSTYFIMISGAFYDVLEPRHVRAVRGIASLGHSVGLHYDEHDDIADGLDILSSIAGLRVQEIAQHNPTLLPRRGVDDSQILDAYDKRIGGELGFTYVSDSGMKWRRKTLRDLIEEDCPRIYALCHPESWFADGRDLVEVIRMVQADEHANLARKFDAFVAGNIGYLRSRKQIEG